MEPLSTFTTAWSIAKNAGEISKKLYELGKSIKDREIKQQSDEVLDSVRELKQSASELEDQNRELKEKLRFKTDEYEFRTPFWYHKAKPDQPLCPKCFADEVAAPMGGLGQNCSKNWRKCLVCSQGFEVHKETVSDFLPHSQGSVWG